MDFSALSKPEVDDILDFIYSGKVGFDNHERLEKFEANARRLNLRGFDDLAPESPATGSRLSPAGGTSLG